MKILSKEALVLQNAYRKVLARCGATAVNFSKERFIRKNWVDRSPEAWKKTDKKKGSTLVSTGQLKRSIRIKSISGNKIIIATDIPYAQIHNEGGTITSIANVKAHNRVSMKGKKSNVKAHKRKMNTTIPKRQFIGPSAILERRIERTINATFKEELTKLQ